MKNKIALVALFLLALLLQRCTEDDQPQVEREQVSFTFSAAELTGGRTTAVDLPEEASLLITLQDQAGEPVLTNHRVALMHLGGSYITEPMELAPGRYTLTDFMVADEDSILYVTPQKASPLASIVARPLPYSFSVHRNKIANVEMEVVDAAGRMPEDFGYASFKVNIVHPLRLAVFASLGGKTKFASAKAYLYKDSALVYQYNLGAKINLLSFKGDPDETYQLVIKKEGYAPYRKEFIYSDLIDELGALPWKIYLDPAFTLTTAPVTNFEMRLQGTGGIITVDWGDGSSEMFDFGVDPTISLPHTYAMPANYDIVVTGAIDQITEFYSYYGAGPAVAVNFSHLSALESVRFGLTVGPSKIDLSYNTNLNFINIAGIAELQVLTLPNTHNIDFIIVSGPNQFSTPVIDAIINTIYDNAVADNVMNGVFGLHANWVTEDGTMVGPPSATGIAQLESLRDDYGWEVAPL